MGRIVLLLLAYLGWTVLSHKRRPRLFGDDSDAFAFPTTSAPAGIDLGDRSMVKAWCDRFDCTEEQLRAATKVVGTAPEDVRRHLARTR